VARPESRAGEQSRQSCAAGTGPQDRPSVRRHDRLPGVQSRPCRQRRLPREQRLQARREGAVIGSAGTCRSLARRALRLRVCSTNPLSVCRPTTTADPTSSRRSISQPVGLSCQLLPRGLTLPSAPKRLPERGARCAVVRSERHIDLSCDGCYQVLKKSKPPLTTCPRAAPDSPSVEAGPSRVSGPIGLRTFRCPWETRHMSTASSFRPGRPMPRDAVGRDLRVVSRS
jgi:hypothetical protein